MKLFIGIIGGIMLCGVALVIAFLFIVASALHTPSTPQETANQAQEIADLQKIEGSVQAACTRPGDVFRGDTPSVLSCNNTDGSWWEYHWYQGGRMVIAIYDRNGRQIKSTTTTIAETAAKAS
jgi:hypothetical protein